MKKSSVQILVLVASLLLGAFSIHGFVELVHQTHTRGLAREFAAALRKFEKSPPGIERADTFVRALKAIDPGYSPAEVKQTLHDYITAFDQSLAALKAGRDTAQYDPAISEAGERLSAAVRKYD